MAYSATVSRANSQRNPFMTFHLTANGKLSCIVALSLLLVTHILFSYLQILINNLNNLNNLNNSRIRSVNSALRP
ncbi:uncharacterized protein K444DRAFT_617761 [Hyaloscypha bicolor E]|uniref:Uncharacterized protein n=1 Tax=Hyaloscypha bicolor E TaxID=1095630 RepID=A0A2J6SWZ8_9HELO|nr:uncharacterized protein K444DRAFT_617761 [Hyaloscypha bicolor E]PMD55300.1 hypothetical protein K444DRAFT_617761 [Hyaloscypha bicolor E]